MGNSMVSGSGFACWVVPIDGCSDKAEEVIRGVVDYIKRIDADNLCSKLGNCEDVGEFVSDVSESVDDVIEVISEETCDACLKQYSNIVDILEEYPQIKSTIKTIMSTICILPIPNCDDIVDGILEEVFGELEQGADELCSNIGAC